MDDQQSSEGSSCGAQAVVKRKKGLSFIWILPIIAALIGAWLIYKGIVEAPIKVVINFESAAGISADKTKVLYKGIELGVVSAVALSPDQNTVDVTVEFDQEDKKLLLNTTQFWLVKPRLSLQGISGLGTVLGGDYIAMDPGAIGGKHTKKFKALPKPPVVADDAPGLHLILTSKDLATFEPGSPVYYEKIEVGEVKSWKFPEENHYTEIKIYLRPEYSHLVNEHTRFFDATGIEIDGGLTGFHIRTESLTSILLGGIAFSSTPKGAQAKNGDQFELFKDFKEAEIGIPIMIHFPTAEGLKEGSTQIFFKGVVAGYLKKLHYQHDLTFNAEVIMDPRTERLLLSDTQFWLVKAKLSLTGVSGLESLIGGKHIQMLVGGKGKPQRKFVALKESPVLSARGPGLHIKLIADELGSIDRETPVYYKKIKVGVVESYELNKKTGKIEAQVFIEKEFQHFVMTTSRFWNASGISVSGGLSGLKIRTQSLESILSSGIAFYTPEDNPKGQQAQKGDTFTLFPGYESAHEKDAPAPGLVPEPGLKIVLTSDQLGSIKEGNKLYYREIEVGQVTGYELAATADRILIHVEIQKRYAPLVRENSVFWNASGISVHAGLFSGIQINTESLKAILEGGIAFATPDNEDMGKQATQNAVFPLRTKLEDHWLEWKPRIELAK